MVEDGRHRGQRERADPDLETVADDVVGFDERGADSVAFGAKDAAQRGELAGSDDGNRREGVVGRNGDAKEDGHDFVSLGKPPPFHPPRSEEHTSELQSLMRISYAV